MINIPQVVADRLGPLVEPLHESFELARHRVDNNYVGLCREDQRWFRTHAIRGLTYQNLCDATLPEGWVLTGNHQQNGAINLAYGSGDIGLRFVHAFGGTAPIAGTNRARRAYYTQRALTEFGDTDFFPTQRLLLLWDEPDPEAEFQLSVVRPLTPGRIGGRVRIDLHMPLPRIRSDFEALEFDTADELESLLFDIDTKDVGNAADDD